MENSTEDYRIQSFDLDTQVLLKTALKDPSSVNREKVSNIIVDQSMKDQVFSKEAGRICYTIVQAESKLKIGYVFRKTLLNRLQQEFNDREETRRRSVQEWVCYVTFICNIFDYVKVNNTPMEVLVHPVYDCLMRLAQPDALMNEEEVDCLVLQLHRIGEQLEKMNSQRMDELFFLLRDGFLIQEGLTSMARLLLLEILEFRAGDKATHPTNRQEDWEYIIGFCDQINRELEGPQIAVTLLVHKIHSPQEWEALQALTVLEACMKNCGRRFHNEVGKYRFLNELIKVVSPKYLGDSAPEKVKTKIVEMLYSWTVAFPDESKIAEAYQTLRKQGLVLRDPELPLDRTLIPSPPTRPKHPVFDNEDMGKLLAELLRSKNPEDLQEANRLIKSMVKEDEARAQKVTKRIHTLEEVSINVKLLTEMLSHYNKDSSSDSDKEIIKELYERCDKLRRAAFKMATETEDNDTSLGDILQASDDLSRVISSYKKIVEGLPINGDSEEPQSKACHCESAETTDMLIDLAESDTPSPPHPAALLPQSSNPFSTHAIVTPVPVLPPPPKQVGDALGSQTSSPSHPLRDKASASLSLLDDELLSLGLNDPPTTQSNQSKPKLFEVSQQWSSLQTAASGVDLFGSGAYSHPAQPSAEVSHSLQNLQDLAMIGLSDNKSLTRGSTFGMPVAAPSLVSAHGSPSSAPFLKSTMPGSPALSQTKLHSLSSAPGSPQFLPMSPGLPSLQGSPARGADISLGNVHVPLETIRPSKVLPVTAYDKDGVRVLINFASDCPPGRSDVLVMVVSMLNIAPLPVHNVVLQAAVPKSMKVKLQPPSGTELAPFNPILPPASITQIMLLANPSRDKVRLRYKLAFTLGDRQCNETGEVDQFPLPETWGHL